MISPVIHFNGKCLEAIELYEKAFTVTHKSVQFYKDAPKNNNMNITEDMLDLVMHSTIEMCGTKFNMSDTTRTITPGNRICFNVFMSSEDEVHQTYKVLSKEGKVLQEIAPQFFARLYTIIIDKFGIRWQILLV